MQGMTASTSTSTLLHPARLPPPPSPSRSSPPPPIPMRCASAASSTTNVSVEKPSSASPTRVELLRSRSAVARRFINLIAPVLVDGASVLTNMRTKAVTGSLKARVSWMTKRSFGLNACVPSPFFPLPFLS
ncbi:hypothetical protein EXIGLDRAFT_176713 [Exidia glandulosa HHB12029]|uniref:Uncharacterized protein n=1 Tax=Exidia glandulosa HHB12029 TaxID=1314781 RepID=A0A165N2K9_EXIGL|nr:hypothetical protein EXIGLDRAFT_176713 [Exidia glandulosa HHB12029]